MRSEILEAAERVFAEEGESGLSIRRLADEVDYSPAAIYRYFSSKDELVDELKEAFFERILAILDESQRSDKSFGQRARQCICGYVIAALEKPHHYAAAFAGTEQAGPIDLSGRRSEEPADCAPLSNKARAFDCLAEMLAAGQADGFIRADIDPIEAAFCTWSACHGMAMIMIHTQTLPALDPTVPRDGIDLMITQHADIFIRGLETPQAGLAGHATARADAPDPLPSLSHGTNRPDPSSGAPAKDAARHD